MKIDKQLNQIKMRWPNDEYGWIQIENIVNVYEQNLSLKNDRYYYLVKQIVND